MCGIVGYTGERLAAPLILEGLRRLEYRGYDSAGIATFEQKGIKVVRSVGKLDNLFKSLENTTLSGTTGIGHTRWATHGKPSEQNAHPHKAGSIVVVHNGIIENYSTLKSKLINAGHTFMSETDTEVIAHLLYYHYKQTNNTMSALLKTVKELKGSFALAVLNEAEPSRIFLARLESPLVIGLGKGENFFASDMPALLSYTKNIVFLQDGDIALLTPDSCQFFDFSGIAITREAKLVDISLSQAEKGGFPHFMLKEIFEQPEAFINTIRSHIVPDKGDIFFEELPENFIKNFKKIHIIACGTSYHAGLIGRTFFEEISNIPALVEIASEFRYKKNFFSKDTLYIFISQSGSTADTLAALKLCKSHKVTTLSICNVLGSSISQESDYTLYTHAGIEIGVASTKAFLTQIAILLILALKWGKEISVLKQGISKTFVSDLLKLPRLMESVLKQSEKIKEVAKKFYKYNNFLYLGRGINYPLAMEGALKLKEISYIHAEAYAAGEMKHGPIALIDENMPVFVINPTGTLQEKTISNVQEVLARGGKVITLVSDGDKLHHKFTEHLIEVPHINSYFDSLLTTIPLQLFAYYCAVLKGTDVDQPRNLAKSVTVE